MSKTAFFVKFLSRVCLKSLYLQTNISNIKKNNNEKIHENIKINMFVHVLWSAFQRL